MSCVVTGVATATDFCNYGGSAAPPEYASEENAHEKGSQKFVTTLSAKATKKTSCIVSHILAEFNVKEY